MDHFGIGNAVVALLQVHQNAARQTGRTTSLIESLHDGDRVVVLTGQERRRIEQLLAERKLDVKVIVVDPREPRDIFKHSTSRGRTLFEHTWVEAFYLQRISDAQHDLDRLQRESSGFGTAHLETQRRAAQTWIPPKS